MYISIVESDRTAVTVGYRNYRKNTTHSNSKTPPRQLQNIVQYVIARKMKVSCQCNEMLLSIEN